MVSRQHAELERLSDGRLQLTDLGSVNGLTVNGKRLEDTAILRENEQVGIGPFLFSLVDQTLQTIDNSQGLRLEASGLEKVIHLPDGKTRKLLDNINLVVEPGEFVSLLGPSGSGKSTLMDCLNGRRRATGGKVLANSVDFYAHFDNFRQSLGYVPQKDIVHEFLTVYRALYYTALLRLPTDTSSAELQARIEEVIKLMELDPHRDTLVANLSGGQIKRVSLGAELLARPSLLYIDEATSGLDAGTEARMMNLFRGLADEGKSLICITHNIENVDRCHLIIVLARGKLIYYGPPDEAVKYFAVPKLSAIYDRIGEREVEVWEKEFAGSSVYYEYVAKRLNPLLPEPAPVAPAPEPIITAPSETPASDTPLAEHGEGEAPAEPAVPRSAPLSSSLSVSSTSLHVVEDMTPPPRPQNTPMWHQFTVLTLRYIERIWTDRRSLYMLLLQAPLVALFVLAGFIGKPYEQKIPVPHISEEEYVALNMLQAFVHDMKAAESIDDPKVRKAVSKLRFIVHSNDPKDGSAELDHQELVRRLKEQRDKSSTKEPLGKLFVTMHANEGKPNAKKMTMSMEKILEKPSGIDSSKITDQLIQAHEIANVTNPRFTYILLFLVSIIVLWSGCNNTAKEIVKEEAIYARERAVNLAILPYVASKFIVMSVLTVFQTVLLMGMVYGTLYALHMIKPGFIEHNEMPAKEYMLPYGPQFGFLALLAMAGVALGLLLSACVSSPDRANALLPYVLIPQIILGGGIMPIKYGVLEWLAWVLSPEYWAFRAIRTGETTLPEIMQDNRMTYDDNLWLPCAVLIGETLVMLIATAWFLHRKDEN